MPALCLGIACALLAGLLPVCSAAAGAPEISAASAVLLDVDSGRILYRNESGREFLLSPEGASPPLVLEDRIWYGFAGSLVARSFSGGEDLVYALPEHTGDPELLPVNEGLLLRGICDTNGVLQWEGGFEGPFEDLDRGYRICDWLGEGLWVDTVYEPDGRIRCYLLRDEAGNELSFLAGIIQ